MRDLTYIAVLVSVTAAGGFGFSVHQCIPAEILSVSRLSYFTCLVVVCQVVFTRI